MWLDVNDHAVSDVCFTYQEYEPFESSLVERFTSPGMTFVDIGAHIGYYTLLAADRVGSSGRVVAVEPAPGNYALLLQNLVENKVGNVQAIAAAALNRQGVVNLYLSCTNTGDHRTYDAEDEALFGEPRKRVRVQVSCIRVDDMLSALGLQADVIKIDVQGAEMLAFKGLRGALANPELTMFCEFWPYALQANGSSPQELLDLFDSLNLSVCEILEEQKRVARIDSSELLARVSGTKASNLLCLGPANRHKALLLAEAGLDPLVV
jgi:FkbM family methyltransferase